MGVVNDEPRPRPNPIFHGAHSPSSKETADGNHTDFSRRRGEESTAAQPSPVWVGTSQPQRLNTTG